MQSTQAFLPWFCASWIYQHISVTWDNWHFAPNFCYDNVPKMKWNNTSPQNCFQQPSTTTEAWKRETVCIYKGDTTSNFLLVCVLFFLFFFFFCFESRLISLVLSHLTTVAMINLSVTLKLFANWIQRRPLTNNSFLHSRPSRKHQSEVNNPGSWYATPFSV